MSDGLKKMIGELGQLMVANDADPQFLQAMQMTFTQYLQQKAGQAAGAAQGQQPGGQQPGGQPSPDLGGGAAGPPTGGPAGQPLGPGSNPGMMGLSSAPAVDELSRMLGGGMT